MGWLASWVYGVVPMAQAADSGPEAEPPRDNPVRTFYDGAAGYPGWTDRIDWERVIDMSVYAGGANDFEKFENARDELHAQGGGVLYYPAGDYYFDEPQLPMDGPSGRGLMLKEGVVIRGEAPVGKPEATSGTLELPTRFHFGFQTRTGVEPTPTGEIPRDWNMIGLWPDAATGESLQEVNDVGIVWVHLKGATIYWGGDVAWGATYASAGGWKSDRVKTAWQGGQPRGLHPIDFIVGAPVGTPYLGHGNGRLVMGCVIEDACVLNDIVMENRNNGKNFGPNGYYMYKFGGRIQIYGNDVAVMNNLLPMSQKAFLFRQTVGHNPQQSEDQNRWINQEETVLFDYNYTTGISVNKETVNLFTNTDAAFFGENVVVRDNRVFNHGRKGFNLSGKWMLVENNINERLYFGTAVPVQYGLGEGLTHYPTLDGYVQAKSGGSGSISDTLSRAFDLAGGPLWITGSQYGGPLGSTHSLGNDGEGILAQVHGGTHMHSWAITHNTGLDGYMAGYDINQYGALWAWNTTVGNTGSLKAGNLYSFAVIGNQGGNTVVAGSGDAITSCPPQAPSAPEVVSAQAVGQAVQISYTDLTDHEVGYAVQRRIGNGDWHTVAIRPRQSLAHAENPPAWRDITAPTDEPLTYRVVALGCDDTDLTAASAPTDPLVLPHPRKLTFTEWIAAHTAVPSDKRDFADDWDADGYSNLVEFLFGQQPDTADAPALWRFTWEAGDLVLEFTRSRAHTGAYWTLESKDTLIDADWTNAMSGVIRSDNPDTETIRLIIPAPMSDLLLRLRVDHP